MNLERRKVLVVEDEAVTALDLEGMLDELGYDCLEVVGSGEEAILSANEKKPHLILMDIYLAGEIDGISAAESIWKNSKIPVVFLTAYSDEKTLSRAKLVQPFGYLLKPYNIDELRTALELAFFRLEESGNEPAQSSEAAEDIESEENETKVSQFLKRIEPFDSLPQASRLLLAENASFVTLEQGKIIFYEGDQIERGFIVSDGRIACIKGSQEGKELVVHLLPPGDLLGLIIGLDDEPAPFAMRAERESTVLEIDISTLKRVLQDHCDLYQEFSETMLVRMRQSADLSRRLAHERVEVRIAASLLMLIGNFAKRDSNTGSETIDITRVELAQLAGTTPETAIRTTRAMEKDEVLDLSRPSRIVVKDLDYLNSLVSCELD